MKPIWEEADEVRIAAAEERMRRTLLAQCRLY
jgi:hypothetical protein